MFNKSVLYKQNLIIISEYAGNLGDGDTDWREQEQTHILSLVDRFWDTPIAHNFPLSLSLAAYNDQT